MNSYPAQNPQSHPRRRTGRWQSLFAASLTLGLALLLQPARAQIIYESDSFNDPNDVLTLNTNGIGDGFNPYASGGTVEEANDRALLITTGNGAQREVINSIDSFCLSNGAPVRVFNWQNVSFSASSEGTANTDRSLLNLTVQTNAADYFENTPAEQSAPDGFYLQFNSDSLAKYTGNGYWTNHTSCLFYKGGGTNGGGYMVELASWQFKTLSWNPAPYNTNFSPNLDIQIVLTTTNWALSILGDVNTNGQPLYFSGAYTNAGINTSTNVGAWDIIGTTNITSDVTNDLENGVGYCIGAENQTEGPGLTMSFGKITVASIANPIVLGPTITTSNELAAFGYNTNTIYSGEALALSAQVSDTSPGANVQYLWQVANEAVPGTFTNLANGTSSNVVINTLPFSDGNNSRPVDIPSRCHRRY